MLIFGFFSVLEFLYCAVYIEAGTSLFYGHIQPFSFNYNTYKKNTFIWGSVSYGDLLFLELFSHWKKRLCDFLYRFC